MTTLTASAATVLAALAAMILRARTVATIARDVTSGVDVGGTAGSDWLFAAGSGLLLIALTVLIGSYWATSRSGNWRVAALLLAVSAAAWPLLVIETNLQLSSHPEVRAAIESSIRAVWGIRLHTHSEPYMTVYTVMYYLLRTKLDWWVGLLGLVSFVSPAWLGASAGLKFPLRGGLNEDDGPRHL